MTLAGPAPTEPTVAARAVAARPVAPAHPAAWWIWALGLAAATTRTTDPVLLAAILAVVGFVVTTCRSRAPWAAAHQRGFGSFLRLGLAVVVVRALFHILLGGATGGTVVLFRLPRVPLPAWASGLELGGPVHAEGLIGTAYDALRLAVLLCCVGGAVALADARQLLRSLPGALYEVGVAVVVGVSLAPTMIDSTQRVRRARELRGDDLAVGGGPIRRVRAFARVALPVLADGSDRALVLAASMDGRGYGRAGAVSRRTRWTTGALVLAGLCGSALGVYALLDEYVPTPIRIISLLVGVTGTAGGLWLGSRRVRRTRLVAHTWTPRSLLVAAAGITVAAGSFLAGQLGEALDPADVLARPAIPLLAFVTVLVGVVPALTSANAR